MGRPLNWYKIPNFSGGRNTQASPHHIGPNQSPDDLNADPEVFGSLKKRAGLEEYSPTVYGSDAIRGLYPYYKVNGDRHLMIFCGPRLYARKGKADLLVKSDFTQGSWMTFATLRDWVYGANYEDISRRFDGSVIKRVGLATPQDMANFDNEDNTISGTPSNTTEGQLKGGNNAEDVYAYKFRFKYGNLGLSNFMSPDTQFLALTDMETAFTLVPGQLQVSIDTTSDDTITLANLDTLRRVWKCYDAPTGGPSSGAATAAIVYADGYTGNSVPANVEEVLNDSDVPTHVQIYRTIFFRGRSISTDYIGLKAIAQLPFYFLVEIPFGQAVYIDKTADTALGAPYPGDAILPMPQAKYVEEHRDRLYHANCKVRDVYGVLESNPGPDFPSRMYHSYTFEPDRIEGAIEVRPEDDDEITAIVSFRDNLIIFKRNHVYALVGSDPRDFDLPLISAKHGAVGPRSVGILENKLIFRGHDDFWAFDGSFFRRVGNDIRADVLDQLSIDDTAAAVHRGRYLSSIEEG